MLLLKGIDDLPGADAPESMGRLLRCCAVGIVWIVLAVCGLSGVAVSRAGADPDGGEWQFAPLPAFTLTSTKWEPKFPYPFDRMRNEVTDTDITAEREMCQWFNAQYAGLKLQIERLNNVVVRSNGNFEAEGVPEKVDAVTANIGQSVEFLAPRAQALTQSQDFAGDVYFPLYQGESFYGLWQQLSNIHAGISSRQPTWFTGPSFHRVMHWGSKINRSKVCR